MTIADRKEREKEHRRIEIIDAAEKLFFTKGISNTTVDEVAEEAELSKGTIYLYYKSKEELYAAIILRGLILLKGMMIKSISTRKNGLNKLYAMGMALYKFHKKYPNYFEAVFYHGLVSVNLTGECGFKSSCVVTGNEMLKLIISVIVEGIKDGSIRSDIDPHKVALSLYGMTSGLIRVVSLEEQDLLKHHKATPEELIKYSYELIVHSLKRKK